MDGKPPKFPGYAALLPPRVRYDKTLPASAKLLYAEISAMSDVTGFCWASNRYLGALYGMTKRTVTGLLAQLQERGYIEIQVMKSEAGAVEERRIFITDTGLMRLPPIAKNFYTPMEKNFVGGMEKNFHQNDTSIEHIPPIVPQGGRARKAHEIKTTADWCSDDFERLWKWYPTGEISMHRKRGNRQKAIRAWDRLHPSPELVDVMAEALARQAGSEEWQEGVGIPHLSTWLNNAGWEGWTDGG